MDDHASATQPRASGRAARRRRVLRGLCASVAAGLLWQPCRAEDDEFAAFRITDVHGSIALRSDRQTTSTATGATDPTGSQSDRRDAIAVQLAARSFVYHPNFLTLDVMLGPIFQRSRFISEAGGLRSETGDSRGLYDLSVNASLFRQQPYPGTLFYEHLNPSVSVGPAVVILQENTRYGFEFALLDPITPVPTTVGYSRHRSRGNGGGRVVDDTTDRYSLNADASYGGMGGSRLHVDLADVDSRSGSVDLPIVRGTSRTLTTGLDTRLQFGSDGRHRVTNLLSWTSQRFGLGLNPAADRRDIRAFLDLRTRHTEQLQSYATVNASNADQGSLHYRNRAGFGGATWWPVADLAATLEARGERTDTTEYATSSWGMSASADYQWALPVGRAQVAYGARFDDRSQRAALPIAAVINEQHVLPSVTFVALDHPRVVPGSVQVYGDAEHSQVFVEGSDYLISVIGDQTRLQRIGSRIGPNQTVFIDYSFDTGGTFDWTQTDQTLSLQWSWRNRLSVYARWFDAAPRLTAGTPLLTLNTVHSRTVGARADLPLGLLWTIGGNAEREDRRETILPFKRTAGDVYLQWEEALFGQGGMRLGARRVRVVYDFSSQDVDLGGWDFRYWVFTPWGAELQADWSTETDVGAPVARRRDFGALRARWSFRQLLMTLSLTRTREEQGSARVSRTLGQWLLQRSF